MAGRMVEEWGGTSGREAIVSVEGCNGTEVAEEDSTRFLAVVLVEDMTMLVTTRREDMRMAQRRELKVEEEQGR